MPDTTHLIKTIEQNLLLPKQLFSCEFNQQLGHYIYGLGYCIVEDCSILTCGCCIAESLYYDIIKITKNDLIHCPLCNKQNVSIVGPVKPLRNIYLQIQSFKDDIEEKITADRINYEESLNSQSTVNKNANLVTNASIVNCPDYDSQSQNISTDPVNKKVDSTASSPFLSFPSIKYNEVVQQRAILNLSSRDINRNQINLINLFYKIASEVNSQEQINKNVSNRELEDIPLDNSLDSNNTQRDIVNNQDKKSDYLSENASLTNNSNTIIASQLSQESAYDQSKGTGNTTDNTKVQLSVPLDEKKEYYFANCFPIYRKRYIFKTHSKFLKTKSKLFINTSISPDCSKFALISKHKWEVYSIPQNVYKNPPTLLFCGRNTGEYGSAFDHLNQLDSTILGVEKENIIFGEYIYCKLSNNFLVISDIKNSIQVFDLNNNGKMIHYYSSKYYIRCIDIDPSGTIIACGIVGKDRKTNSEQALITLHRIGKNNMISQYDFPSPITVALPYRDPINTIQLSTDGRYLSCSTTMESRFLIISLKNVNEPRLIMKSLRSIDTSLESEGITDTKLFPGNPSLMCVTSTAFNSPAIIVNTKIEDISNLTSVAQPTLLNRFSDLGYKIHKCEISSRNDSIAFLDKNGSVYLVSAPTIIDNEKRRTVVVEMVADAYRAHESASMRFSCDGYVLYILDRKGVLYVEDFAYDLPQNNEITKCKEIT
ncbi:Ptr3p PWA37_003425 [Arxiozyma heterogenica]|uniref:Ptr3p n=1 Tax=Arxiozyma heterogenica TaxID=278026 RepID=UPI002EEA30C1